MSLADINLQMDIVLGRASLAIKDVMTLTEGSVIELDRMAGEPVIIRCNQTPYALGEVVVIDECFSVRITKLLTAAEVKHFHLYDTSPPVRSPLIMSAKVENPAEENQLPKTNFDADPDNVQNFENSNQFFEELHNQSFKEIQFIPGLENGEA